MPWSATMIVSGELKLNPTIEYPEEDFEPMPEGDKQRRNLSYTTEALRLLFEPQENVYVSGNLFILYEENKTEKRVAPDTFVVVGTSKEISGKEFTKASRIFLVHTKTKVQAFGKLTFH